MKMVKDANPMLEDIRQPMEGPHVKEKREAIANETSHYRDGTVYKRGVGHVKVTSLPTRRRPWLWRGSPLHLPVAQVDREQRRKDYLENKPYLTLELRLLDGQILERKSSGVPADYFGLILAFGAAFPWHRQEVVPEWDDGTAIHPQRATAFDHGSRVVFREFAPPGGDLLTTELQRAGAGFESEVGAVRGGGARACHTRHHTTPYHIKPRIEPITHPPRLPAPARRRRTSSH